MVVINVLQNTWQLLSFRMWLLQCFQTENGVSLMAYCFTSCCYNHLELRLKAPMIRLAILTAMKIPHTVHHPIQIFQSLSYLSFHLNYPQLKYLWNHYTLTVPISIGDPFLRASYHFECFAVPLLLQEIHYSKPSKKKFMLQQPMYSFPASLF